MQGEQNKDQAFSSITLKPKELFFSAAKTTKHPTFNSLGDKIFFHSQIGGNSTKVRLQF